MSNLQRIDSTLNVAALCILILLCVILFADIHSFYEDKDKYAQLYRSSINQQTWERDYLRSHVYIGLFALAGVIIIILRFIKTQSRAVIVLNRLFIMAFYVIFIAGFFYWMASGYDH